MKAVSQTVRFDDEGSLHDVLAANGIGAQSVHDDLNRMLDAGMAITIEVPGMPPRALVRKSVIEKLVGTQIQGTDLIALPFA